MRVTVITLALVGLSSPALATTFIDGTVNAGASVTLDTTSDSFTTGPSSTSVPGTLSSLSFGSVSSAPYQVSASAFVSGTWASADAGTVDIQWGWNSNVGPTGLTTQINTNGAIPNWSYTFTATGDGSFSGRYSVAATGDVYGLQPIYGTGDMPFGPYGGDVNDPNGAGSFSVALVNGTTYTMGLFNFGNLGSASSFDANGSARALVDWTISYNVVPEPASWAMMITGFGLVGAAARRRRTAIAA